MSLCVAGKSLNALIQLPGQEVRLSSAFNASQKVCRQLPQGPNDAFTSDWLLTIFTIVSHPARQLDRAESR